MSPQRPALKHTHSYWCEDPQQTHLPLFRKSFLQHELQSWTFGNAEASNPNRAFLFFSPLRMSDARGFDLSFKQTGFKQRETEVRKHSRTFQGSFLTGEHWGTNKVHINEWYWDIAGTWATSVLLWDTCGEACGRYCVFRDVHHCKYLQSSWCTIEESHDCLFSNTCSRTCAQIKSTPMMLFSKERTSY